LARLDRNRLYWLPRRMTTVWLTHPVDGQRFRFDPGRVCLAFAFTGGEGEYAIFETLHHPRDLADWLAASELHASVAAASADDVVRARRLRQAIWLTARAVALAQPTDPRQLAELNAAAAEPPLVPKLANARRQVWAEPVRVSQALSTLARDAIDLFSGPDAARIRECAAANCLLLFVDTSRPGVRRWCSMDRCGNRAKLRAHRRRAATQSKTPDKE
jgi:predicted RNA-binding Zn ribbon-like protein